MILNYFVSNNNLIKDSEACPGLHQGGQAGGRPSGHLPGGVLWPEDCQVSQVGEEVQGYNEEP